MESQLNRYKRYIRYIFEWIFLEKLRGLDFTMRKRTTHDVGSSHYNGYSKTDKKHIDAIFSHFKISESDCILDIGCGKGFVLKQLTDYGFGKFDGIEYDSELCHIAEKNFKILKLSQKVHIFNVDAMNFENYGDYNYFYFFNSFSGSILKEVINRISSDAETGGVLHLS